MKNRKQLIIFLAITIWSCNRSMSPVPVLTQAEQDSINLFECDKLLSDYKETANYSDLLPIPKDLDECYARLDKVASPEIKEWIKCLTEEQFTRKEHFSLGMGLRNQWGLWHHSELARYFYDIGIFHPDDMSGIILTSYHRRLSKKPIMLNEQVGYYQAYWTNLGENVDSILELVKNENTKKAE